MSKRTVFCVGQRVRAIKVRSYEPLTLGKYYKVLAAVGPSYIYVIDDDGDELGYHVNRFIWYGPTKDKQPPNIPETVMCNGEKYED